MPRPFYKPGQRVGRLTIVSGPHRHPKRPANRHPVWLCRCDCGTERHVIQGDLRNGTTRSCGCLRQEMVAAKNRTHGQSGTATYRRWKGMVNRCRNANDKSFRHYGGRGITVCARWTGPDGFANFLADMGECPGPGYDIDRHPDNDGNYEPGNCRWAIHKENCRNTRATRLLEHNGESLTLSGWAERLGVSVGMLSDRINKLGWSVHDALTRPVSRR